MAGGSPSRDTRSWTAMFRLSWRQRLTFALRRRHGPATDKTKFSVSSGRTGALNASPGTSRSQFLPAYYRVVTPGGQVIENGRRIGDVGRGACDLGRAASYRLGQANPTCRSCRASPDLLPEDAKIKATKARKRFAPVAALAASRPLGPAPRPPLPTFDEIG